MANFKAFTHNMLRGLNWNNVCVAGGGVLACLMPGQFGSCMLMVCTHVGQMHLIQSGHHSKDPILICFSMI